MSIVEFIEDRLEELEQVLLQRIPRNRVFNKRVNDFDDLDEYEFFARFRLCKSAAKRVHDLVMNKIKTKTSRNRAVPSEITLLLTLRYLATGCFLRTAADFSGVSPSTASRVIKKVTEAIALLSTDVIKFPDDLSEVQGFYKIARFPRVIGVIDCTQINIISPECGLVRPTSSGFFTLLPLAQRAIDKLEKLINHHLNKIGAQKLSLPSLTVAKLWERTGRLKDVGQELVKVEDRHGKKYLLAPTHEEAIAELLADISPISYKQLPILLYQISNKYRDEHRPKHGLLRAREFRMLDAYAVHTNDACATSCYDLFTRAYADIFRTLQLSVHRVLAPTGDMGGSLSHEWQLPASAGEDTLAVCPSCSHTTLSQQSDRCEKCGKETERVNSIEVGHTFVLGTRYSSALGSTFTGPEGTAPLIMSCYGIGITRLLAGSIEALSTETAIRWPPGLAPYSVMVIGPKEGSKEWSLHDFDRVVEVARRLSAEGREDDLVVDDRHSWTIGKRLMMADRMGYPYVVVCGRSSGESPPRYELYRAPDPRPLLLTLPEILDILAGREVQRMENIA